jgi:hypothetical protein
MLSPFIKELNESTHVSVSMGVFGLTSLLNAVLVMMLPETKDCNIPDTIEQVETRAKQSANDSKNGKDNAKDAASALDARRKIEAANALAIIGDKGITSIPVNGSQMNGTGDKNGGFIARYTSNNNNN